MPLVARSLAQGLLGEYTWPAVLARLPGLRARARPPAWGLLLICRAADGRYHLLLAPHDPTGAGRIDFRPLADAELAGG